MSKIKYEKLHPVGQYLNIFEILLWQVDEQLCLAFPPKVNSRFGALLQGSKLSSYTTCFTVSKFLNRGKLFVCITHICKYLAGYVRKGNISMHLPT